MPALLSTGSVASTAQRLRRPSCASLALSTGVMPQLSVSLSLPLSLMIMPQPRSSKILAAPPSQREPRERMPWVALADHPQLTTSSSSLQLPHCLSASFACCPCNFQLLVPVLPGRTTTVVVFGMAPCAVKTPAAAPGPSGPWDLHAVHTDDQREETRPASPGTGATADRFLVHAPAPQLHAPHAPVSVRPRDDDAGLPAPAAPAPTAECREPSCLQGLLATVQPSQFQVHPCCPAGPGAATNLASAAFR